MNAGTSSPRPAREKPGRRIGRVALIGCLLGGGSYSLFKWDNHIKMDKFIHVETHIRGASDGPAPAPDAGLWERLGLVVEDARGEGVTILKVLEERPAIMANVPAGERISELAAEAIRPADLAAKPLLAHTPISTVTEAESLLRRAIDNAERSGLDELRIEFRTWKDGFPSGPFSFVVPLDAIPPEP